MRLVDKAESLLLSLITSDKAGQPYPLASPFRSTSTNGSEDVAAAEPRLKAAPQVARFGPPPIRPQANVRRSWTLVAQPWTVVANQGVIPWTLVANLIVNTNTFPNSLRHQSPS
jgi:hypothetical protein